VEHGAHFLILYYPPFQRWRLIGYLPILYNPPFQTTVRNFPTHGQLSAAQGSLTSCLNLDFAILNVLTPRLCSLIDGPDVEHGAHFLIVYYPPFQTLPSSDLG
jgi:hypothetical protein